VGIPNTLVEVGEEKIGNFSSPITTSGRKRGHPLPVIFAVYTARYGEKMDK
jgi:hypothetical protein